MASAMTTLMSLSRLMPFLRPRYTVTPASRALTNRIAISSPNEGVMPNTRASAASTVGREMHMVTAVQNSRPRMKNTSTQRPRRPSFCLPMIMSAAELMRRKGLRRMWNM